MGLESATYISGLVDTNPAGSDDISQGDDHLKLIKSVLKTTLPNANAVINGIHSSAVAPSSTSVGQIWFDEGNNLIKIRNEADDAWIILLASEGSRLLKTTHTLQSATSSLRSATYIDSGLSITHVKLSSTSNLYIQLDMFQSLWSNFSSNDTFYNYIQLTNSSGTIITGTTANIVSQIIEDVGQGTGVTWDSGCGYSRLFKVTAANCPDGSSGSNTFKIYTKLTDAGEGGTSFPNSTMMCWEVEE